MNHVPDVALAEIDAFAEGWLRDDPPRAHAKLRDDLRFVLWADEGGIRLRFETAHTRRTATLRDRGSFVTTIVEGIESRLREWGFEPPTAYEYVGPADGRHRYEGPISPP